MRNAGTVFSISFWACHFSNSIQSKQVLAQRPSRRREQKLSTYSQIFIPTSVDKNVQSIVAVHGLEEDPLKAWTDSKTGTLWLCDLLPDGIAIARILTYGYNAKVTEFYGHGSADRIQAQAHTLVAELQADRGCEGCSSHPVIFVCHGFGGILVKKALAYSSTRTGKDVQHLYSIYVSTYAILFFGTPHHGTDTATWLTLSSKKSLSSRLRRTERSSLLSAIDKDCETLQAITDQFSPLFRRFRIFFFWEELETDIGGEKCYLVDESSAAPMVDNTERAGIWADHFHMVQFSSKRMSSFRIVLEALKRYCRDAPSVISRRWQQANKTLASTLTDEAYELVGEVLDDHVELHYHSGRRISEQSGNKYFSTPQRVSGNFTGRESIAAEIRDAFWPVNQNENINMQKRYIVYGIGGSGKTQFCSKFAQDHRPK